eukprot:2656788-Rhodomonas_salina.2
MEKRAAEEEARRKRMRKEAEEEEEEGGGRERDLHVTWEHLVPLDVAQLLLPLLRVELRVAEDVQRLVRAPVPLFFHRARTHAKFAAQLWRAKKEAASASRVLLSLMHLHWRLRNRASQVLGGNRG